MTVTETTAPPRRREAATPAIDVRGLTKTYPGGVEAVKGIDFHVATGEVFGLLGPNGAGKSTTVGMLTTTLAPTSGTALLAGIDVAKEPIAARHASSVVFQDPVVDRSFTGRRNLDLHARLWSVASARRCNCIWRSSRITCARRVSDRSETSRSATKHAHRRATESAIAANPCPVIFAIGISRSSAAD